MNEMIATLRKEYDRIQTIDPESPTYAKICEYLDGLTKAQLKALMDAKIKFISGLARNRFHR